MAALTTPGLTGASGRGPPIWWSEQFEQQVCAVLLSPPLHVILFRDRLHAGGFDNFRFVGPEI
jgi:hypothetical protein